LVKQRNHWIKIEIKELLTLTILLFIHPLFNMNTTSQYSSACIEFSELFDEIWLSRILGDFYVDLPLKLEIFIFEKHWVSMYVATQDAVDIDWGDGIVDTVYYNANNYYTEVRHRYNANNTCTVTIYGRIIALFMPYDSDLRRIECFGSSLNYGDFTYAEYLIEVPEYIPSCVFSICYEKCTGLPARRRKKFFYTNGVERTTRLNL
jgi:hypothetical protein